MCLVEMWILGTMTTANEDQLMFFVFIYLYCLVVSASGLGNSWPRLAAILWRGAIMHPHHFDSDWLQYSSMKPKPGPDSKNQSPLQDLSQISFLNNIDHKAFAGDP